MRYVCEVCGRELQDLKQDGKIYPSVLCSPSCRMNRSALLSRNSPAFLRANLHVFNQPELRAIEPPEFRKMLETLEGGNT